MANAQTPVANRVKSVVKHLPKTATPVAKYTDNYRHCLYYIHTNRLYQYDVMTGQRQEVLFANSGYDRILSSWLSPDGNFMFFVIEKDGITWNTQELWRYDSRTKRTYRVGQGYHILRTKEVYIIKKATRVLNPGAPLQKQKWMGQEHHYDLYGNNITVKDEYVITEKR